MRQLDMPFLPGREEPAVAPLARYLPPVPPGMAADWLEQTTTPGDWLLDPFGSSPLLAIEAAQSGRRVLAAVNNPITRFALEVLASAPTPSDFQSALADLASARRGGERLELSIRAVYASDCAACGRAVEVRAFLWEKGGIAPYARIYTCPNCGDSGERPVSPGDLERLAAYPSGGLHHARALERVAAVGDPTREDVQEALECYLPRPLYALFSLINRVEGLAAPPARKALLMALMLSACDDASALWPQPPARSRPRQLAVPPRFREKNLWRSLEESVPEWTANPRSVPLCIWPDQPPETGGITLFQGRLKDLAATLPGIPLKGILTAIPRPAQAFWTLSALWSGWLWGREAVRPLKSVLSRRRYDWSWHTSALEAALSTLPERLPPGTPFFGIFAELEPGLLAAGLLAAQRAGFSLHGTALRSEEALAQVLWKTGAPAGTAGADPNPGRTVVKEFLVRHGEPVPYITLYTGAAAAMLGKHPPQKVEGVTYPDPLSYLQSQLKPIFNDRTFLTRLGGGEHTIESGLWWLATQLPDDLATSDRVEMEVVRALQKSASCDFATLDGSLCAAFPGLLTPSTGFIRACLASYGEESPPGSGCWRLRAQEEPAVRRNDLKETAGLLYRLGIQLGYTVEGESPILWKDIDGRPATVFYLLASAVMSRFVYSSPYTAEYSVIVLPGSRANLVAMKLHANPLLQRQVAAGWRFLKFRHLRSLAANPLMDREQWSTQVGSDPPEYEASQLSLF